MDNCFDKSQLLIKYFNNHLTSEAMYNRNGKMVIVNTAMTSRYNISKKSDFFLSDLFENTFLTKQQKEDLKTGKNVQITHQSAHILITPLKDEAKDECIGYHLLITDVASGNGYPIQYTEIKNLYKRNKKLAEKVAENRSLMELALQNSRATVYSFDYSKFNTCDKTHCKECFQFYGSKNNLLKSNQYICQAIPSIQQADDQNNFFCLFNKIREERLDEHITNFKIKDNNGQYRNCEIVGKTQEVDSENKPCLIIGCIIDNQKYIENEEALLKAKKEAETADQLKSVFLANMTHDIRTPLHAIVGFAELLSEETDIEMKQEYISLIKTNNELLVKLISDILDISKIESDLLTFDYINVPLQPFMKDIYMTMKLKTNNKDVELILDSCPELVLNADKNRLSQILLNLLSNAAKHTTKGNINFGYKLDNEFVRFYVSDSGCGIPEKEIKNIFSRFVQVKGYRKDGIGLGLAICKGLVTKMGGTISVFSEEEVGSTFSFTIPYKKQEKKSNE